MKNTVRIAVIYTTFATIATIANIGSQEISIRIYTGIYSVVLSILIGTATGLIVKYLLDKKKSRRGRTTAPPTAPH